MKTAINGKTFGLKNERACIEGKSKKEKYMEYQNEYRAEYGVFPELDCIHKPFTARWDDVYNLCCMLRKPGVGGALYYHDLHSRYRSRLKKIYEAYSREWAFLLSIDPDNRTTLIDIAQMYFSRSSFMQQIFINFLRSAINIHNNIIQIAIISQR